MVAKSSGSTFLFFLQVHFDCFCLSQEAILTSFYSLQFHQKSTSFKGTLARIELHFSASDTNSKLRQNDSVCRRNHLLWLWVYRNILGRLQNPMSDNTHSVLLLVEIIAILSSFWIPILEVPGNSIGGNKFFRWSFFPNTIFSLLKHLVWRNIFLMIIRKIKNSVYGCHHRILNVIAK
jgi:hypothetical protein